MEQLALLKSPIEDHIVEQFSANGLFSDKARRELEERFSSVLEITDRFNRQSVSYQLSKKDALHRWFKYKEGFSANLVNILLNEMGVQKGDLIMDPFMGSGTTALVCQMRGINSIGYDVMPISEISIKAKAAVFQYDLFEMRKMISEISQLEMPEDFVDTTPFVNITKGAYPDYTRRYLAFITRWKDESQYSDLAKNLLTLSIVNSLERISYTTKAGQYLGWDCRSEKVQEANRSRAAKGQRILPQKYVREVILDAKPTILEELEHIVDDIETIQNNNLEDSSAQIQYVTNSVLYELPKLNSDTLNGVITSPPYCNRYDYTRTYALELVYLGEDEDSLKTMRQNLLSCTVESKSKMEQIKAYYNSIGLSERFSYICKKIGENEAFSEIMNALVARKNNGDLNNNGIIRMVEGYFTELAFIYAELYRICKKGASVAFVNDNVRYGGEVIPVDFLSSSFAEQFGFKTQKIYTLKQQKGNSSQQMAKYGRVPLRKSITIWEK